MKIYLRFLITAIVCLFTSLLHAQIEKDTRFKTQMNYNFANLAKSKVPNGILRDYSMGFTNPEIYNSVTFTENGFVNTVMPGNTRFSYRHV